MDDTETPGIDAIINEVTHAVTAEAYRLTRQILNETNTYRFFVKHIVGTALRSATMMVDDE